MIYRFTVRLYCDGVVCGCVKRTVYYSDTVALKYKIVITGIQGDAKLNEAIEWTITNTSVTTALDEDYNSESKYNILVAGSAWHRRLSYCDQSFQ